MSEPSIRAARTTDLVALQALIQRSYRGETSRIGWTNEADLIEGERVGISELEAIHDDAAQRLLIAWDGDAMIGTVRVADAGGGLAYLGQICVEPALQAAGHGKRLIAAAEATARDLFGATRVEMTVIAYRTELIDYYQRRGYTPTGERRAFPISTDPPLVLVVLERALPQ